MVMVKRSVLQLCRTTIFLAQLWMAGSDDSFRKWDQKNRQMKNQITTHQIPKEKLSNEASKITVLFLQMTGKCCIWQDPSLDRIIVSLKNFPWYK